MKRDHNPVVSLADFDRAPIERAPGVAPRQIKFEDPLDDQHRKQNQVGTKRDHHFIRTSSTEKPGPIPMIMP